jgi:hypothetical protein
MSGDAAGDPPQTDEELRETVAELATTLERLEETVEGSRGPPRPPRPNTDDLRRFTAEVAIPGLVLVLESNVRALKLLQRALRRNQASAEASSGVRGQAERVTRTALAELDTALSDLSAALEATADDETASTLLSDARTLQDRLDEALETSTTEGGEPATEDAAQGAGIDVDVDAELESLKDDLDEEGDAPEGDSPAE